MFTDGKLRIEITVGEVVDLPRTRGPCEGTGQSIEVVVSDTVTDVVRGTGSGHGYTDLSTSFGHHSVLP